LEKSTEHIKKAVFLDRDGVINADSPDYIKRWEEFRFLPGSLDAIRRLTENRYTVIVITNQSAVGREMISLDTLNDIHGRMCRKIAETGGRITDIFFCPHHPDEGCACRKPKPGMILKAAEKHAIDLTRAWMIGDSAKDVECGLRAGCRGTILLKTGKWEQAQQELEAKGIAKNSTAAELSEAVGFII
jgi:histidinol-phosphate phosphatase family protein